MKRRHRLRQRSPAARSGATNHQPHTHVEHPVHLFVLNVAETLHPPEDRLRRPRCAVDNRTKPVRQNARNVFDQPSAGDVRHALDAEAGIERAAYAGIT